MKRLNLTNLPDIAHVLTATQEWLLPSHGNQAKQRNGTLRAHGPKHHVPGCFKLFGFDLLRIRRLQLLTLNCYPICKYYVTIQLPDPTIALLSDYSGRNQKLKVYLQQNKCPRKLLLPRQPMLKQIPQHDSRKTIRENVLWSAHVTMQCPIMLFALEGGIGIDLCCWSKTPGA